MRFPITGYAQRVSDTVERAMTILKDRKDPAMKSGDSSAGTQSSQSRPVSGRSRFRSPS